MADNERRGYYRGRGGRRGRGRGRGGRSSSGHIRDEYDGRNNGNEYRPRGHSGRGHSDNRGRTDRHYRSDNRAVHWNRDNRNYDNRNNRDVPEDLRRVIDDMGNTIAALTERLETMKSGRTNKTTRVPPSTNFAATSHNDDFAPVCKTLYRWVQINHHRTNWERLPKSIDQRLNRLTDDIKPPMTDDGLRSALADANKQFGEKIRSLVSLHLRTKQTETELVLGGLDPTDVDRAKNVASKYLNNHLGRRLLASRRDDLLDIAAAMVGSKRGTQQSPYAERNKRAVTPPNTAPDRRDPPASQRKRRATDTPRGHDTDRMVLDVDADDDTVRPSPPNQTTKKHKPSADHTQTNFGVYQYIGAKDTWTIAPDETTTCVVIGDSNLRNVSRIPPNWEVHSLAGAHLNHVTGAIRRLKCRDAQKVDVIVQAGINHRDRIDDTVETELQRLASEAEQNQHIWRIFFAGVATPSSLPDEQADNIRSLNTMYAQIAHSDKYIAPIPAEDVNINATDHFGIHHTTETADKIMYKIYRRVTGRQDF